MKSVRATCAPAAGLPLFLRHRSRATQKTPPPRILNRARLLLSQSRAKLAELGRGGGSAQMRRSRRLLWGTQTRSTRSNESWMCAGQATLMKRQPTGIILSLGRATLTATTVGSPRRRSCRPFRCSRGKTSGKSSQRLQTAQLQASVGGLQHCRRRRTRRTTRTATLENVHEQSDQSSAAAAVVAVALGLRWWLQSTPKHSCSFGRGSCGRFKQTRTPRTQLVTTRSQWKWRQCWRAHWQWTRTTPHCATSTFTSWKCQPPRARRFRSATFFEAGLSPLGTCCTCPATLTSRSGSTTSR
mmetsp:Transcript_64349/g.129383  ORF Transcript_64349/g.129383 Transcript_64349/m.129383 type:complete len:299 (-) Transcript_64349:1464-2360(-)